MDLEKLSKAMNIKPEPIILATWSTTSDIKLLPKDEVIRSWMCRDDRSRDGLDQPGFWGLRQR